MVGTRAARATAVMFVTSMVMLLSGITAANATLTPVTNPNPVTSGSVVTVTVGTDSSTGGSAGSAGAALPQVHLPCWMEAGKSGKEYAWYVDSGQLARNNFNNPGGVEKVISGYKAYADVDGFWYSPNCLIAFWPDPSDTAGFDAFFAQFYTQNGDEYVRTGQTPPTPAVAPALLRDIAISNLRLPPPELDWNPKLAGNQGTLVNLKTWFWLKNPTGTAWAKASVPGNEATVTATFKGMKVSAPGGDGKSCPGPITPYSAGGDPSCGVVFSQASSHLGLQATPVTVTATWFATWAANTVEKGAIAVQPAPVTPPAPTDIQVDEIQTLVTSSQ